jgi:hypothetical protein
LHLAVRLADVSVGTGNTRSREAKEWDVIVSVPVKEFLKNRRDRALGTILGNAERDVWPKLTRPEQEAFRRVVIDALNSYHDSVLDLVKSEDSSRNDVVLEILEKIDRNLRRTQPHSD